MKVSILQMKVSILQMDVYTGSACIPVNGIMTVVLQKREGCRVKGEHMQIWAVVELL